MGSPLYHGNGVRYWCGMSHAQTYMPHLIHHMPPERLELWHRGLNTRRFPSTPTSTLAITLFQWQWRPWACLGPRLSLSSRTSVGISGRSQGSQGHWNISSNESRLLCSREMQLLFLGQWEVQLDWKLHLAECTLHYLFVCSAFVFLFFILPVLLYFRFLSCCTVIIIISVQLINLFISTFFWFFAFIAPCFPYCLLLVIAANSIHLLWHINILRRVIYCCCSVFCVFCEPELDHWNVNVDKLLFFFCTKTLGN